MEYGFIFDMDGVVIDSNPYHKIAWESFLDGKGYAYDEFTFENMLSGRTGPTSMRLLFGDDLPDKLMEEYLEELLHLTHMSPPHPLRQRWHTLSYPHDEHGACGDRGVRGIHTAHEHVLDLGGLQVLLCGRDTSFA